VFGLDNDDPDVFDRTVDWAVSRGITTATFHILTPYPGTALFKQMVAENRILHFDWDQYDTRTVVYQTRSLSAAQLKQGYDRAYRQFYRWSNIARASLQHEQWKHRLKHFTYAGGWKKFEPLWNFIIKTKGLNHMLPLLETILSKVRNEAQTEKLQPFPAIA
jgi:radical SAM superfamily enzyme YgiQ (UPF0313 family)